MGKKFGLSFSFFRLIGFTVLKQRVARKTGIPLTRGGFNAKIGRFLINLIFKK
jgi:hypothetical protein